MADLSVTAANVLASTSAQVEGGYLAGATITAGQVVFLDANNTWQLAGAAIAAAHGPNVTRGIALNGAASGQPIRVALSDPNFKVGATVTAAQTYVVSATAGNIAPISDLTTGNYVTVLFVAKDASYGALAPISVTATHA
jgi:hypothetical protein